MDDNPGMNYDPRASYMTGNVQRLRTVLGRKPAGGLFIKKLKHLILRSNSLIKYII